MNVMVDLETMSTKPNAAIVSIGAVKFDAHEVVDEFYRSVKLETCTALGLAVDADTLKWWVGQSDKARAVLNDPEAVSVNTAVLDFTRWVNSSEMVLWGNGSDFDNVILRSAYEAVGIPAPWKFWNNRCYRTVKSLNSHVTMDRQDTHHNALDDAKSQALHLIKIWGKK